MQQLGKTRQNIAKVMNEFSAYSYCWYIADVVWRDVIVLYSVVQ